jgi:23S rRNA pseudouridine1911/1915/1917 synthase
MLKIVVTVAGERLDQALLRTLRERAPGLTRARLKGWFESSRVRVSGRPAQASHPLERGTHEVLIEGLSEADLAAPIARPSHQGSFLPVLFEDETLLVLHKHSGVPTLPHDDSETETAVGSALARCPELAGVGGRPLEPGLLHRLDTGTSGCLAFAKTQARFDELRALWKTPAVRKFYRALVPRDGFALRAPYRIDTPLAASEKSAKRMVALPPGRKISHSGKPLPALTHVLKLHPGPTGSPWLDLELEIETGVRHQIRAHLASLGHPIAGDPIYGLRDGRPIEGLHERLWLHAWRLELPFGHGAERGRPSSIVIEAALPTDWPRS